jgi:hypothetical protein
MRVRIVLRQPESGQYYRAHGECVGNAYDALTFANILEAGEFCRAQGLTQLQVIQQSGYFYRAPRYQPAQPAANPQRDSASP